MGAEACGLHLINAEGTALELVSALGFSPATVERGRIIPLSARLPATEAFRSGEAIWIEDRAASLARYPGLATLPSIQAAPSGVSLPLKAEGRTVGILGLT